MGISLNEIGIPRKNSNLLYFSIYLSDVGTDAASTLYKYT